MFTHRFILHCNDLAIPVLCRAVLHELQVRSIVEHLKVSVDRAAPGAVEHISSSPRIGLNITKTHPCLMLFTFCICDRAVGMWYMIVQKTN